MKSRLFLNLFMLLTLGILIAIALLYQPQDQVEHALTDLNIEQIDRITIPREKGDIRLQKTNGRWYMTAPYKMPAHDFRIQQLLKLSQLKSRKIYGADQVDLKQFALQPPRARIQLNDTWIDFGTSNPVSQQRYIKSGNTVMLVHDDSYPLINSQPSSFVNLSLLPENSTIQGIELPEQKLQLSAARWQLRPPDDIDPDSIQSFIQNWKMAQAFGVHAYMKRKQLGQIIIHLKNQDIYFEISDKSPWLILARPDLGIEYHLDESQIDKLLHIKNITSPVDKTADAD